MEVIVTETVAPSRPALRYFGSKWRLAKWIIGHFPYHECYVEPFCGGASVFFQKTPAEFEVLNDLDGDVVNFFRVLRETPDILIRAIQCTPYSRQEYNFSWQPAGDLSDLERARRYYVRIWQGWGGAKFGGISPAWRFQHSNNRGKSVITDWNQVDHLQAIVGRLKQAFIENDDALAVIRRYDQPHTLFYLDPPYLPDTRTDRWSTCSYQHEVGYEYHCRLLDMLQEIRGMAVISGYPNELYDERLANWQRAQTRARTTNTARQATEVIWISPSVAQSGQRWLPLFPAER
jgi:DNA adenine methylase